MVEDARPRATGTHGFRRSLGRALLVAAATTVAPGAGHLLLGRRRVGVFLLGLYLMVVLFLLSTPRSTLLSYLLSADRLLAISIFGAIGALAWAALIVRCYQLARPDRQSLGRRLFGAGLVLVLCLLVVVPLCGAAGLANTQRTLLDAIFHGGGGGTPAGVAIAQPRINVLLLGSDAGPDRTGARTDTVMVASIDTRTARTVLFALPRNLQRVQFPPGTPMAARFPNGFGGRAASSSGEYLLSAIYPYAHQHPELAPSKPTDDPGVNLLSSSVSYLLGLPLDYYVMVDMAGFVSLIDAVGGIWVDVGPEPIPIGGVTASGQHVKPDGYLLPGVRQLDGQQALWFARSRRDGSDYQRMARQRCLLQAVLEQKNPTDLLIHFQALARAATASVRTNIPADVLPALATLAARQSAELASVSFEPHLADSLAAGNHFNTAKPDLPYVRQTVNAALAPQPVAAAPGPTSSTPEPLAKTCRAG